MIIRPISRSISRGIGLAINDPNGAGFDPLSLFAAGEQGVWYDPSDMSTLFQDPAGTIPVTAAGQPVGKILDKSGRGNHATQATATSRPVLQTANGLWYLAFDGVDDWMLTGNINFNGTDKLTISAGIKKLTEAQTGTFIELSANSTNVAGAFAVYAPVGASTKNFGFRSNGSIFPASASATPASFPPPVTVVLTAQGGIATDTNIIRINGAVSSTLGMDQGGGNYANLPLYIGRRGGALNAFNGNIYSLIARGAASSSTQISDTEWYINSKTGAY